MHLSDGNHFTTKDTKKRSIATLFVLL